MNIETRIKEIRESKRIKLAEVAAVLEIDVSNYAKMEKRGNKLSIEQLEKISEALGVSVIELMTGKPQNSETSNKVLVKENEELKKRIDDLENSLKDKELINQYLSEKNSICEEYLYEILDSIFMRVAIDHNNLGTMVYIKDNKETKITNQEFNKLTEQEQDKIFKYEVSYEFSESEIEQTMKVIFTSDEYKQLSSLIMWTGMIKDERFIRYFKKFIVSTNTTVNQIVRFIDSKHNPLGLKDYNSRDGFKFQD